MTISEADCNIVLSVTHDRSVRLRSGCRVQGRSGTQRAGGWTTCRCGGVEVSPSDLLCLRGYLRGWLRGLPRGWRANTFLFGYVVHNCPFEKVSNTGTPHLPRDTPSLLAGLQARLRDSRCLHRWLNGWLFRIFVSSTFPGSCNGNILRRRLFFRSLVVGFIGCNSSFNHDVEP